MNSTWYENFEKEMKQSQKKYQSNSKKKMILMPCIIFGMLLAALLLAIINNPGMSFADLKPLLYIAVFFVVLILFCFLLMKGKGNKDWTKDVRKNLESILTTQELVTLFDQEMAATPLYTLAIDSTTSLMFTSHFLVQKSATIESTDYRFAKLSDIAANNFAITEGAQKFSKLYFVDLLDSSNKKLMGLSVPGREKMNELEETLSRFCPGIRLKEHKLF